MMKFIFILLFPLTACSQAGYFANSGISPRYNELGNKWIGIQGQSNASGLSPRSYLYSGAGASLIPVPTDSFQRVLIYNHTSGTFQKLKIGTVAFDGTGGGNAINTVNNGSSYEDGFGPEIGLALRWMQETRDADTLFITKYAIGGSTISNWISPGGGYYFTFEDYYDASAAIMATRHPGLTMTTLLFDQGEANGGDSQATYYGYLQTYTSQQFSNYGVDKIVLVLKNHAGARAAQIQAGSDIDGVDYYDSVPYEKVNAWSGSPPYNGDATHYHPEWMLFSGGRDFFNIAFNTTGTINGL